MNHLLEIRFLHLEGDLCLLNPAPWSLQPPALPPSGQTNPPQSRSARLVVVRHPHLRTEKQHITVKQSDDWILGFSQPPRIGPGTGAPIIRTRDERQKQNYPSSKNLWSEKPDQPEQAGMRLWHANSHLSSVQNPLSFHNCLVNPIFHNGKWNSITNMGVSWNRGTPSHHPF